MARTLGRRLGTADVVVLGLVAMLGSGVFVVLSPAGAAAGPWLLLAVLLAAVTAAACASSTAELILAGSGADGRFAAGYTSGYVAARERLHPALGRLAAVTLLVGGVSSAAAAAGVFGAYVLPSNPLVAGIVVIVVVTALNIFGVRITPGASWLLAGGTLAVLLVVVVVGLLGPGGGDAVSAAAATPDAAQGVAVPTPLPSEGVLGVLSAAGMVFFAFVGFANVATAGEDVRTPAARTLRRALPIALGVCAAVYLAVGGALLVGLGTDRLGTEHAPLVALVDTGQAPALGVLVRIGAAVAAGSTLLAVLVGISRTAMAMGRRGDLPLPFAKVCGLGSPWRSDVLGAALAIGVAVLAGPVASIALSACAMLLHYVIVHAAALRIADRRRWVPVVGLVLCLGLAALLPPTTVVVTLGVLAVSWLVSAFFALRARRRPLPDQEEPPDEQAA